LPGEVTWIFSSLRILIVMVFTSFLLCSTFPRSRIGKEYDLSGSQPSSHRRQQQTLFHEVSVIASTDNGYRRMISIGFRSVTWIFSSLRILIVMALTSFRSQLL
jgi:hypothetical protein